MTKCCVSSPGAPVDRATTGSDMLKCFISWRRQVVFLEPHDTGHIRRTSTRLRCASGRCTPGSAARSRTRLVCAKWLMREEKGTAADLSLCNGRVRLRRAAPESKQCRRRKSVAAVALTQIAEVVEEVGFSRITDLLKEITLQVPCATPRVPGGSSRERAHRTASRDFAWVTSLPRSDACIPSRLHSFVCADENISYM
jgi:hypothetical protein